MTRPYAPIEDYGIIGDLYTIGLVGMDGSIDFLCLPSFDSPSVFAALLDAERGGRFQLAPLLDGAARKQLYLPDTTVLLTRFLDEPGVGEVSDFMPVEDAGVAHNGAHRMRKRTSPRTHLARRTRLCATPTSSTGMKSDTSPTPGSSRKRVSSTLVSGR